MHRCTHASSAAAIAPSWPASARRIGGRQRLWVLAMVGSVGVLQATTASTGLQGALQCRAAQMWWSEGYASPVSDARVLVSDQAWTLLPLILLRGLGLGCEASLRGLGTLALMLFAAAWARICRGRSDALLLLLACIGLAPSLRAQVQSAGLATAACIGLGLYLILCARPRLRHSPQHSAALPALAAVSLWGLSPLGWLWLPLVAVQFWQLRHPGPDAPSQTRRLVWAAGLWLLLSAFSVFYFGQAHSHVLRATLSGAPDSDLQWRWWWVRLLHLWNDDPLPWLSWALAMLVTGRLPQLRSWRPLLSGAGLCAAHGLWLGPPYAAPASAVMMLAAIATLGVAWPTHALTPRIWMGLALPLLLALGSAAPQPHRTPRQALHQAQAYGWTSPVLAWAPPQRTLPLQDAPAKRRLPAQLRQLWAAPPTVPVAPRAPSWQHAASVQHFLHRAALLDPLRLGWLVREWMRPTAPMLQHAGPPFIATSVRRGKQATHPPNRIVFTPPLAIPSAGLRLHWQPAAHAGTLTLRFTAPARYHLAFYRGRRRIAATTLDARLTGSKHAQRITLPWQGRRWGVDAVQILPLSRAGRGQLRGAALDMGARPQARW